MTALVRLHGANTRGGGASTHCERPTRRYRPGWNSGYGWKSSQQAQAYVARHSEQPVQIGAALFDRKPCPAW